MLAHLTEINSEKEHTGGLLFGGQILSLETNHSGDKMSPDTE
jgi:hypothetical protein